MSRRVERPGRVANGGLCREEWSGWMGYVEGTWDRRSNRYPCTQYTVGTQYPVLLLSTVYVLCTEYCVLSRLSLTIAPSGDHPQK
jgi:hypothetical protein